MPGPCSFDDCDRPKKTRGLCDGHYTQLIKGKELAPLRWRRKARPRIQCSVHYCERPVLAKGFCSAHYHQDLRGEELRPPRRSAAYNGNEVCEFEPCDRLKESPRWCGAHALQAARGDGTLRPIGFRMVDRTLPCLESGCSESRDTAIGYCHQHARRVNLLKRYGLSQEDYAALLALYDGTCHICRQLPPDDKVLAIDHDHSCCPGTKSCGRCVRGLLCSNCNTGIGNLGDSEERLLSAMKYLTETKVKEVRHAGANA